MAKAKAKEAGRKANGNVTIDLGEAMEKRLRSAGMAGSKSSKGYRPGKFGSYRPSFAGGGLGKRWELGAKIGLPATLNGKDAVTGALVGTLGNRVLRFVTPKVTGLTGEIAVNAINFGVGIVPFLAKPNSMTVGIGLPGLVYLAGSLADYALDRIKILGVRPPLSGSMGGRQGALDAALAARQRLADIQARIGQQTRAAQQYPRVQARPQFVG